jgi:hypothetical protein
MNDHFFETLSWFIKETKSDATPIIVYGGERVQKRSQDNVIPWTQLEDILK